MVLSSTLIFLFEKKVDYLQEINITRLILMWIYFRVCKFCNILRGFISMDGEMLILLPGVVMICNAQICNV